MVCGNLYWRLFSCEWSFIYTSSTSWTSLNEEHVDSGLTEGVWLDDVDDATRLVFMTLGVALSTSRFSDAGMILHKNTKANAVKTAI